MVNALDRKLLQCLTIAGKNSAQIANVLVNCEKDP